MMNRNSEATSTNNEVPDVTEDRYIFPPWSDLPFPAVENIYSFLNRTDQKSMSSVCRNWREEHSSPSLWRNVTFCVSDIEDSTQLCPDVIFARRYGAMFRDVKILFPKITTFATFPLSPPADGVLSQLILFLGALTRHSQLLSISFKYMLFSFTKSDEAQRLSDVYQKILKLLESQKNLQRVEFTHSEFEKAEAVKILNVIFVNNSKTLRSLLLRGFVQVQNDEELEDSIVEDYLNYTALTNLEILVIDYTRMFESMILSFYENRNKVDIRERKGNLEKIYLFCNSSNVVDYLGIQPPVWHYLRKKFPNLRIELTIFFPCDTVRFSTYIVAQMPIRVVHLALTSRDVQVAEIRTLFSRITSCNINESVEELKIAWKGTLLNIVPHLIRFTNVCPELKILELESEHPAVAGLHVLFVSWLINTPASLHAVKITLSLVQTELEKTIYSNSIDYYAALLQPLELRLSFDSTNEYFTRHLNLF